MIKGHIGEPCAVTGRRKGRGKGGVSREGGVIKDDKTFSVKKCSTQEPRNKSGGKRLTLPLNYYG